MPRHLPCGYQWRSRRDATSQSLPERSSDSGQPLPGSCASPAPYDREYEIKRVIAVWPAELADDIVSRSRLLARLEAINREQRRRGASGHWAYDPGRHQGIINVIRREKEQLDKLWEDLHAL